jgi:quinol monooxygenase YgiN
MWGTDEEADAGLGPVVEGADMSTDAAGRPDAASPAPMPDLVAVLAQFIARPGRETKVRDGLLRVVDGARTERGNLDYDLLQHNGRPWAFYVLANWADQAAADAHVSSSFVRDFLSAHGAADLAATPTRTNARMLSHPDPNPDRQRPIPNSNQLTFLPFFSVKPGQVDAVREALLGAIDSTRAEDGCLDYDLYQSFDDPAMLFYRENWTGQPVLDKHMNTPGFYKIVRGEIDPRLTVPWSGLALTMISAPGSKPLGSPLRRVS